MFLALSANAAVTSKSNSGSRQGRLRSSGSAHAHWSPMDLGLGEAGDLSSLRASFNSLGAETTVPGEGGQMIEDEMLALQQQQQQPRAVQQSQAASEPRVAVPAQAPPMWRKPTQPLSALAKAQAQGLMVGADFDSDVSDDDVSAFVKPEAATTPAVAKNSSNVEEYDEVNDEDDTDADESRTVPMNETGTREEMQRVRKGDVEHLKSPPKRRQYLVKRVRKLVAAQQQAKESKGAIKEVAAAVQAPPSGKDKMMNQCLAFAAWVKGQGSTGPDFVRIWKGTCLPTVMSGSSSPQYSNMCNALGTAVGKFALKPWTPPQICQAVVQVFGESGVGASPLV